MTEPTFDPAALTERQLDGLACVVCGDVFAAGSRSVPAGEALGAQVVACASHVAETADTKSPTWPDDEAASDRVAELEARVDALQRQLAELTEVQRAQAEVLARAVEQMAGPRPHVPRPKRHLRLVD